MPTITTLFTLKHRSAAVLTAALIVGAAVAAGASPAVAHDSIISATPAPEAKLNESPTEVTLTFSDEVFDEGSSAIVNVLGPDGTDLTLNDPLVEGTTVTQPITGEGGNGSYTVQWRVVSSDGHPISDEYHYSVDSANAPTSSASPTTSPTTPASTAADPSAARQDSGAFLSVMATIATVGVLGAGLVLIIMMRRARRKAR
ncbi:copper resistance CopC family protein [Microbacterium sp. NPDC080220]|uniref:copper resistance CopC family protein n=1 Tax=Microbacterium sp. NPDC080220 TaxID=3161017 RepID=UPI00343F700A